jgi:hypothetical protein
LQNLAFKKKLMIAIAAFLLAIALPWGPAFPGSPPNLGVNDYSQHQAPFTLPFHLVDGYIMVDGTVNDVPGRFLFDTATPWAFYLNNASVPLGKDQFLVLGHAASGQEMPIYTQAQPIDSITLGDQT